MKVGNVTLSGIQIGIVVLTVITALIHIVLGIGSEGMFLVLFLLNGLGYLALLAALYFLPQFAGKQSMVRWVFIGYTAVTVILYFVFNGADAWNNMMGLLDKAVELALIGLLVIDMKR